jgi:diguanylate cyclase (GGDEF)-like protein/PAS domain S-box-containing protein
VINPHQRAGDKTAQVTPTHSEINASTELATTAPSKQSLPHQFSNDICSIFGDGLVGINKEGKIIFINKVACKLTGWSQSEAENQSIEKIFQLTQNSDSALNQRLISQVIESGELIAPDVEQEIRTKNNQILLANFSLSPLDRNSAILMFHQFKQNNELQNRAFLYQANYDPLTRLFNRNALQKKIGVIHSDSEKNSATYSALLLNLDRFKLVNDRYGQVVGDKLLQLLAERILFFIRDNDVVGRWAGEEFLCVLPNTDLHSALNIAERLRQIINEQAFILDGQEMFISASIGIANYPLDGKNPEELFCTADATLYEAKRKGRNRVQDNQQLKNSIFSIGSQLEKALNNQRIISVHQPIFSMQNNNPVAEEALARIQEKNGNLIEAGEFIDAAVKFQLVHRIDYKIIKSTITRCCINYSKTNLRHPHFVNVSADFLRRPELVNDVIDFAKKEFVRYGLGDLVKKPLVIEITEQELLHDIKNVQRILAPFIDLGLELAIDDFGSGYSSLTYLADLPISYLKIDGSLVKRVVSEDRARKIITGIQLLAESLGLITIAEHIEDKETFEVLREIGVAWGQGYFSARPAK